MKKLFLIAFFAFILSAVQGLYAQQKFSFGVQGGIGAATAHNNYTQENEYTSSVELGIPKLYPVFSYMYALYFSYKITDGFGIAAEPGILRKGYGTKTVMADDDVMLDRRRMDYLQLPLLAEFYIDKFVFSAGPEFGYLLNKKMKTIYDSGPSEITNLPKNNRFDFGLQIGGYYMLMKHLDVGLKIGASFTRSDKYYLTNNVGDVLTRVSRNNTYINPYIRIRL